jgi:hypothetical protein
MYMCVYIYFQKKKTMLMSLSWCYVFYKACVLTSRSMCLLVFKNQHRPNIIQL